MQFRRVIISCLWTLLSVMFTFVIILGALYTYMELQLPDVSVLKDVHLQVPLRVYSSDGKLIAQYGAMRRIPVTLDQVPKPLINAVLATEDARFYSHPGVDLISLARAAKAVLQSGRKVQGASTITMQVARNFFLTRKKTYSRKIKEILLALKIDKELSKDKILELYLNKVYFGNRAYGVAAAAKVYYGKTLDQLTLPEMAMIAGMPQAPSRNNPLQNPVAAKKRRDHVLRRMYEVGFIDNATYLEAIKAPMTASYHEERTMLDAPYVAEMVRQVMVSDFGVSAYDRGFSVYTTISSQLQKEANRALHDGLIAYTERHGFKHPSVNFGELTQSSLSLWQQKLNNIPMVHQMQPAAVLAVNPFSVQALLRNGNQIIIPWSGLSWARPALKNGYVGSPPKNASSIVSVGDLIWVRKNPQGSWQLTQIPEVQGSIVVIDPQTGAVLALAGGFDYQLSNFNRATQAERQPGSSFKPFIYSSALAKGYTLASMINDAPVVIRDTGENELWRPANDTMKFYGPTRLRIGLTKSRNLVSVRLLRDIGIPYALNFLRRFGFNADKLPHTLSLALGAGTVTPVQIAAGYSVFANGGYQVMPYFIGEIMGQGGQMTFQADPAKACEACITQADVANSTPIAPEVLTPQNAYLMTQALRGVIQTGTGRAARVLKRTDLAGKTGTTNKQVDAWFSGFNSHIEVTVWVGFDDSGRSLHEYGAQVALPIWIQFMKSALQNMPEATMPRPAGIVTVRIDPRNGLLANPNQQNAIFEVFRKDSEPHQYSSLSGYLTSGLTPGVETHPNMGSKNSEDASDQPIF